MANISIFVLLLALSKTLASPDGAPAQACLDMTPSHGVESPQETPAPYQVTWELMENGVYVVNLTADDIFRGFFVQVRREGSIEPLGVFTITDAVEVKLRPCPPDSGDNGVTHTSNNEKESVTFEWSPEGVDDLTNVRFVRS